MFFASTTPSTTLFIFARAVNTTGQRQAWTSLGSATSVASVSPLTTKGDLLGHSTVDARIPVGSDGQVLTADSTQALGVKYATPAVAAGSGLIQLIQFATAQSISGTVAATFTNASQKGSAIVVEYVGVGNVTSISDSQTNGYAQFNAQNWSGLVFLSHFVALNIPGGATITVTATGAGSAGILNIYEYSNVDKVDTSISAVARTTLSTGSITTSLPLEVIHMTGADNSATATVSNSSGWPLIQSVILAAAHTVVSYNTVQAVAGSVSNTFNSSLAGSGFDHTYVALLALQPRAVLSPLTGITTIGTAGAATVSGGIVNIPVYSSGGGGGGSLVLLESHTASSSTELDFIAWLSGSYDVYEIHIVNLVLSTSATMLWEASTDGGLSYDTSSKYHWTWNYTAPSSGGNIGNGGTTAIAFRDVNSAIESGGSINGKLTLFNPGGALFKLLEGRCSIDTTTSTSSPVMVQGGGQYRNSAAVNAFRFILNTGNFTSGTVRIYGITH